MDASTETGSAVDLLTRVTKDGARHHSTTSIVRFFAYNHLRSDLAEVSKVFADAMLTVCALVDDGPELAVALRKLLEGKDAAVRQALVSAGLI